MVLYRSQISLKLWFYIFYIKLGFTLYGWFYINYFVTQHFYLFLFPRINQNSPASISTELYANILSHNKSTCSLSRYPEKARINHLNAILNLKTLNQHSTAWYSKSSCQKERKKETSK